MEEREIIFFRYFLIFNDGKRTAVEIQLDPETLSYIPREKLKPSSWTKLENNQCQNCPLKKEESPECPLALNLSAVIPRFSELHSFEKVHVIVESNERTYSKNTTLQNALSAMLGIFMVTSDCPVMKQLRPMVRFHLPFANVEETVFRAASTYLLGEYFKFKQGKSADWELNKLKQIYADVQLVNHGMAARMRNIVNRDANLNALVVLDVFAKELPFTIEKSLQSLEYLYKSGS